MSEELKPCPFCGSSDIDPEGVACFKKEHRCSDMTWDKDATEETIENRPACTNCGATTEGDWNARAETKKDAEIARLREALCWVDVYVSSYCVIIHPEKNVKELSPEQAIKNKIDEALKEKTPRSCGEDRGA